MSSSPFISAIVPCFNVGSLLERTIDSLLGQTLPPREILVIDDASTSEETLDALRAAEAIPSVTVLRQPTNQGVAAARNRGLDTCRGDFAVFLDADDLFTASSLEAFHTALVGTPDASFAYPTVTCFGNRSDTFPAPEFNAYLLHHANICPIASMITRAAIDSGVRFDPLISVGHEDWDYWLRLVEAGHLGCAAPEAVLLYRRVGFTRNDLGNQVEGGFDARLRSLRTSAFEPRRLVALKRTWAPGLSLITHDPERVEREVTRQTCQDVEVLTPAEAASARGRVVAFEWSRSAGFLAQDRFAVEDMLAMGHFIASRQMIVSLSADTMQGGTPSGIPRASDTRRGWVAIDDITAVALPNHWATSLAIAGDDALRDSVLGHLRGAGVADAHLILWRTPQQGARLSPQARPDRGGVRASPRVPQHVHGWTREVLTGLPSATPWALASPGGNGLFGHAGPSSFRESVWVRDPFAGHSLYGTDENQLIGSQTTGHGPPVHRASAQGTVPLKRIEDGTTHRRAMTTGDVPPGWALQEVVGHVEAGAVPGSRDLRGTRAHEGNQGLPVGRAFSTLRDDGMTWPHSSDLLFQARVVWRAARENPEAYRYGMAPTPVWGDGMVVQGRAFVVIVVPDDGEDMVPLFPYFSGDGHIGGFTTVPDELPTKSVRATPLGYLYAREATGRHPVTASRPMADGSIACQTELEGDPGTRWAGTVLLGYSIKC